MEIENFDKKKNDRYQNETFSDLSTFEPLGSNANRLNPNFIPGEKEALLQQGNCSKLSLKKRFSSKRSRRKPSFAKPNTIRLQTPSNIWVEARGSNFRFHILYKKKPLDGFKNLINYVCHRVNRKMKLDLQTYFFRRPIGNYIKQSSDFF